MVTDEPEAIRKSVCSFSRPANPASGTVNVAVFQVFVPVRVTEPADW
jgi:hypothetical protein